MSPGVSGPLPLIAVLSFFVPLATKARLWCLLAQHLAQYVLSFPGGSRAGFLLVLPMLG